MNAYLVYQTQQMERAKTFAEIRRIEARVSRMAQAKPDVRRPGCLAVSTPAVDRDLHGPWVACRW
jgi:hypothetical protein